MTETSIGYNYRDLALGRDALETCAKQIRGVVDHIINEGRDLRQEWGTSVSGARWDKDQGQLNIEVSHFATKAAEVGRMVGEAGESMQSLDRKLAGS